MKGSNIRRAAAPLAAGAANDNFSAATKISPAQDAGSADTRASFGRALVRFVRPILIAGISAAVMIWLSGAFVVGLGGIAVIAAAFAGWHVVRRRKRDAGRQRTHIMTGRV
jgi:hypothetical protein